MAVKSSSTVSPRKGGRPVRHSYRITPQRVLVGGGAGRAVIGELLGGEVVRRPEHRLPGRRRPDAASVSPAPSSVAMPKSRTTGCGRLSRGRVARKMFDGLRSRCVMPRRWAADDGVADRQHDLRGLHGRRAVPDAGAGAARSSPVEQLHDEEALPRVLADLAHLDDVGVADARGEPGLPQEAGPRRRDRREGWGENLDGETFAGPGSHPLVNGAHRSDTDDAFDPVIAEPCPRLENGRPLMFHRYLYSLF